MPINTVNGYYILPELKAQADARAFKMHLSHDELIPEGK
jgi:hypothetical protein